MSKMGEISSYLSHFVAFRPNNVRFLIFEFWVIWDQMSKCPKWAHHHPIWAFSWCLDMILHVLWDIQQKSGKKSKTNRKFCALRQSLICGLILESSKLTHCLHNRTIYSFLTWSYTFCEISRKNLAKNLRRIENFVLWDNHSSVV